MTELKVIKEQKLLGKQFIMYGTVENPLFLAKDVANWIDHSNPRMMLQNIDEDEKQCVNNPYALKGQKEQWFLTEDGLYEVLMQSRKPIAKQFKKEVKTILRQIRKTGGYIPINQNDDEKTILAKAVGIYQRTIEEKDTIISKLQPYEEKYNQFLNSKGYISLNKVAKGLGIGRNKMMAFLRANNVLFKDGYDNLAYQRFCNNGYFKIYYRICHDGTIHGTTRVSPRGIDYIHKLMFESSNVNTREIA